MQTPSVFFDKKNEQYAQQNWANGPSLFVKEVYKYFPKNGKILELGAGGGQDARFLANKGFKIIATDYSKVALRLAKEELDPTQKKLIHVEFLDLSESFPYESASFDVVYCHLSIHYFDNKISRRISEEIYRVLKPGGVLAILVNSISDPEYGTGGKLEEDFFKIPNGSVKRFFSEKTLGELFKNFHILLLDNKGGTHKDKLIGVENLIRLVARK